MIETDWRCILHASDSRRLSLACGGKSEDVGNAGAPPPVKVEKEQDVSSLTVDHPEQFPLVKAADYSAAPTLSVTGTVNPDISRTVPVISLATGRVVEIRARLGDTVKKGPMLLLRAEPGHRRGRFRITAKRLPMKRWPTSNWSVRSCCMKKAPFR